MAIKMKQGTGKKAQNTYDYGYWMLSDGTSNWGIGAYRGEEIPLKINASDEQTEKAKQEKIRAIHNNPNVQEKIAWHEAEREKIKQEQKDKEAKAKK